jgi:hypothetical protein
MRLHAAVMGVLAVFVSSVAPAFAQDDAPTYGFSFVPPAPASGTNKILKIQLNSDDLHAGGPIAIRVTTTPDVTQVVTGNGRHQGSLTRISPGIFTSQSTLPHVGGLLHVHIKLHFEATTADGRVEDVDVPVAYK